MVCRPPGECLYGEHPLQRGDAVDVVERGAPGVALRLQLVGGPHLHLVVAPRRQHAGLAVDRRAPVPTLLRLLGNLVTERTRFLIEHLAAAAEYLKTGRMPRSLRRSDDFDDLVLLARCDRDGRERGAPVRELHEALRYVAGIDAAWDAPADAPDK